MTNLSVTASFASHDQAASAVAKLRALRVEQVSLFASEASEELSEPAVRLTAEVNAGIHPLAMRVLEQCGGK